MIQQLSIMARKFLLQWNLDLTKSLETGWICSLNQGSLYRKPRCNEFEGNEQNVHYIEVKLMIDLYRPAYTCDFCYTINTILVAQKWDFVQFFAAYLYTRIEGFLSLLVCSVFIFCRVLTLIRYIEVDFAFGLPEYVRGIRFIEVLFHLF